MIDDSIEGFDKSTKLSFGLIPIVIGVTGHRDVPPEDIQRLTDKVTEALKAIAGCTKNSEHVLLSALAEGADRIVARAALDNGWLLGAVLPAPVDIYEQDFKTAESLTEFQGLLGRALWIDALPSEKTGGKAYREAGLRMARQSHYLLALWDGDTSNTRVGGTADIVNLFLTGIPDATHERYELDRSDNFLPEARPVWHILTRRMSALDLIPANSVGDLKRREPMPGGASGEHESERWDDVIERIDQFNSDSRCYLNENPGMEKKVRDDLKNKDIELPSAIFAYGLYKIGSAISQRTQKQRNIQLLIVFALALAGLFCQQSYSGPIWVPSMLAAAIGFGLLATCLLYWGANRRRLQEMYFDYRSLAEVCRVQYFWKRAGVSACAADHFLRDQRDVLEWLRQAVRTTELMPGSFEADPDRIKKVSSEWIDVQRNWFVGGKDNSGGKAAENDVKNNRYTWWAYWLLGSGIAVAIVLLLLHLFAAPHFNQVEQSYLQWMIVLYSMLFGASGIVGTYLEIKAFPEQARAYRRAGLALGIARRNIDAALERGDLFTAENVLLGAGRDALEENGSWLLLHRDRPSNVPLV